MAGRLLLARILAHVARVNSREIFTAAALVTVLGLALMMQAGGLSMSLGAFLAGVLLADSEFRHELEAVHRALPGPAARASSSWRWACPPTSRLLVKFPWQILGLTAGPGGHQVRGAVRPAPPDRRAAKADARLLALALAQGGEFAFVLFDAAQSFRVLGEVQADKLTLVVALSMALSPLLLMLGDRLAQAEAEAAPPRAFDRCPEAGGGGDCRFRAGRADRRPPAAGPRGALHRAGRRPGAGGHGAQFGLKVFYGDAGHLDLLHAAQVGEAKVLVLAIDDVEASLRTAELVRRHFPHVQIVARARNRFHASRLMDLGIERQIRETLPASLEMARWTLELPP